MTLASPHFKAAISLATACLIAVAAHCLAEPLSVGQLSEPEPEAAEAEADKTIPEVAEAVALFQQRKFNDALIKLKEAVSKHPKLPPPQIIMAQFFAQAKQTNGVRASLEKAVIESPTDPEAFVILGDIALRERRVTEAALLFGRADQLRGSFKGHADRTKALQPRILGGLASVALAREDWAGAEARLLSLLKLNDKNARAMQQLARALFKQGTTVKTKACNEWTKKAYEADKERVLPPPIQMARLYAQADDFDNAKTWMDYAMKTFPNHLRARLAAAQWYWQTSQRELKTDPKHLDAAEEHVREAMKIDKDSIEAIVFRGVVALFKKDFPSAERYFEAAYSKKYDHFPAKNNLALALCEQADPTKKKRALQLASENVRLHPKSAEAMSTYGWVLYQNNKLPEAERALRQAASSGGLSADTAYYVAQVMAESNRENAKAGAIQLLESSITTKRPFSKREEAQKLLADLKKAN